MSGEDVIATSFGEVDSEWASEDGSDELHFIQGVGENLRERKRTSSDEETAAQQRKKTVQANKDNEALSEIEASVPRNGLITLFKALIEEQASVPASAIIDVWHQFEDPTPPTPPAALPQNLFEMLKPHQIEGLRFLWAHLVVAVRRWKDASSLGCILAHSMGLGKTAQIVILMSLMTQLKLVKTILVLAPKSTLQNWVSEISKWSELAGEELCPMTLKRGTTDKRLTTVANWQTTGGVLCIGYEQYCTFVGAHSGGRRVPEDMVVEFQKHLRNPGPDMVICDEGHIIRNDSTSLSKALATMKTNRRVVVSGTPLQNNLSEYWAMIDFVKPGYFPKQSFDVYFKKPLEDGQSPEAKPEDLSLMRDRIYILQQELVPLVHRRGQSILRKGLPKKDEYVIFFPLSKKQADIFSDLRQAYLDCPGNFHSGQDKNLFAYVSIMNKLSVHPDILRRYLLEKQEPTRGANAWAQRTLLNDNYASRAQDSPKLVAMLSIVAFVVKKQEKLLVFSQYKETLDYLEKQIGQLTGGVNTWRLDGDSTQESRTKSIGDFQTHRSWGVFLITTTAGGVGINLCTAHKTVLFDVAPNPAVDQQAICRGYRYGLQHPVAIYRLVSDGTPEANKFSSCVSKEWMAKKVIDHGIPSRENAKDVGWGDIFHTGLVEVPDRLKEETAFCLEQDPLLQQINEELKRDGEVEFRKVVQHESLLPDDDAEKFGREEEQAYCEYIQQDGIRNAPFRRTKTAESGRWSL